jgi:regulator of protease activity HflC (stomatin/prohibitin superfamily)
MSNITRFPGSPLSALLAEDIEGGAPTTGDAVRDEIEAALLRYLDFPNRVQHVLAMRQMARGEEQRRRRHVMELAQKQRERELLEGKTRTPHELVKENGD